MAVRTIRTIGGRRAVARPVAVLKRGNLVYESSCRGGCVWLKVLAVRVDDGRTVVSYEPEAFGTKRESSYSPGTERYVSLA